MPYSIRFFIAIWVLYFLLLLALPVASITGVLGEAVAWQIIFVCLVIGVASVTSRVSLHSSRRVSAGNIPPWLTSSIATRVILMGLGAAVLGLIAQMYDKVFIQQIDYMSGLAIAREQWRSLGEGRDGVSSKFSVVGYLLSTSFIVALCPAIIRQEAISARLLSFGATLSFFLVIGNSVLTGGRSLIFLTAVFALAFYAIRRERGGGKLRISRVAMFGGSFAGAAIVAYTLYVFAGRANATGEGIMASSYVDGMLEYLGAVPYPWLGDLEESWPFFGQVLNYSVLALTYLTHSVFTFAAIIDNDSADPTIMFSFMLQLLAKLDVVNSPDLDWILAGRALSLPGMLFHDGGAGLLLFGGVMLGTATGFANRLIRDRNPTLLASGLVSGVYVTIFISPVGLAADLLSFPFIILEFILFSLIFDFVRSKKLNNI